LEDAKADCESEILKGKFTADPSAAAAGSPSKGEAPAPKAAVKPAAKKK
jgi:hypothetical protein